MSERDKDSNSNTLTGISPRSVHSSRTPRTSWSDVRRYAHCLSSVVPCPPSSVVVIIVIIVGTRSIPISSIPAVASSVAPSPPSAVACGEKEREKDKDKRGWRERGKRRRRKKKTEERERVRQ